MIEDKISKVELELLSTAIDRIISTEVLEKSITEQLPLTEDLSDTNKIYCGKASVLFVDMRESTKLSDRFSKEQLVKIYRSYIRAVVQAVRYSGGVVRDFMGDGILSVFVDDEEGKSEDKAVHAARYITTIIDKILNPELDKSINHRISCGIGIHTGDISLSKVGMRGKEQDETSENEFGIAWIGNSTNLACKYSGVVDNGTILISSSTYSELSDIDEKQKWERFETFKGGNMLEGYMAKQYYLPLDTDKDIKPYPTEKSIRTLSLVEELKQQYQKQLVDIIEKAEELGEKEQNLKLKEQQLNDKKMEIDELCRQSDYQEQSVNKQEYLFYCNVLNSGFCKRAYIKEMGKEFWEDNLDKALLAGHKIGKSEHEIKQEISCVMVNIYGHLEIYDKAYDFLVEQATGYAWLNLSVVQDVVKKVGCCSKLKSAIDERLKKDDLSIEYKEEFKKIKDWLVFEYEL